MSRPLNPERKQEIIAEVLTARANRQQFLLDLKLLLLKLI